MIDEQARPEAGRQEAIGCSGPAVAHQQALAFWGRPTVSRGDAQGARVTTRKSAAVDAGNGLLGARAVPGAALNALRALVVASPDYQTC